MAAPDTNARPEPRQFRVDRCLGRGGFGEVYLARMVSAGGVESEVAVKVLHADLDPRSQAVQRLRDEGRLLGVLNHPAILRVTDLVVLDGRVALVTEYVDGADLDQCIEGADPMPLRPMIEVLGRVADALDAAYNRESDDGKRLCLVHRDIKPSNIRVGRHGDVKVLDFGIAKATDGKREAKTQTNAIIGSLLYMAPERFDEDNTKPSADIYALGCTLYEALTHQRLFDGISVKKQYGLAFEQRRYVEYLQRKLRAVPEVPAEVQELLIRLLAYDPADRPDATELSALCDRLADSLDGPSLRRWCKGRQWPVPAMEQGLLDGRTITETTLATADSLETLTSPHRKGTSEETFAIFGDEAKALLAEDDESGGRRWVWAAGFGVATMTVLGAALLAAVMIGGVLLSMDGTAPSHSDPEMAEAAPLPGDVPATTDESDTATPPGDGVADPGREPPGDGDVAPTVPIVTPRPAPVAVPAPAPTVVPAPRPVPAAPKPAPQPESRADPPREPAPNPDPVPAPETAPPATTSGTVVARGSLPFELRGQGKTLSPGPVPAGSYAVWADFGSGAISAGEITVRSGQSIAVQCSRLRETCLEVPP